MLSDHPLDLVVALGVVGRGTPAALDAQLSGRVDLVLRARCAEIVVFAGSELLEPKELVEVKFGLQTWGLR